MTLIRHSAVAAGHPMSQTEMDPRTDEHARLLRGWMADKGLKAPSLALSIERYGEQIGADYIRKLARGERELSGVVLPLREAMRQALRVPAEVWEAQTGLATAEPQGYGTVRRNGSGRQGMNFDFSREDPYAKPQSQLSPGHQMISPGKVLIPIYGTATAGSPADFLSEGNIMNYAVIDQAQLRNGNTIAITVSGMSMQPTFTDSETVLIDKSLTDLEDRGVYLICVEGQGVCLKRARLRRGAWWLTSDNPDHDEFQADEATVIGRVYFAQPAGRTVS